MYSLRAGSTFLGAFATGACGLGIAEGLGLASLFWGHKAEP